jgi:hypothetical protein
MALPSTYMLNSYGRSAYAEYRLVIYIRIIAKFLELMFLKDSISSHTCIKIRKLPKDICVLRYISHLSSMFIRKEISCLSSKFMRCALSLLENEIICGSTVL